MQLNNFSEEFVLSLATNAYNKGMASFPIKAINCAFLVIDMQDEFVKPNSTPYWVPEATKQIPKINSLIEYCRSVNIPIIFTVFSNTKNFFDRPKSGSFMPNRYPNLEVDQSNYFIKGNLWKELSVQNEDIIIHKPSYGAFYDTPLESILKNLQKDTVIISGTLTNFCCGTTARQAYERGFYVVFGSDITATDDPTMQEPELKVLRKGFAKVLTSEEIINELNKSP